MFAARSLILAGALLGSGAAHAAAPTVVEGFRKWTAGWDYFNEPLDYVHSGLFYVVDPVAKTLTLNIQFVHATPNKSYQIAPHFFCNSFPATFGQFPGGSSNGACNPLTRQGVTQNITSTQVAVVTTDVYGNGSVVVQIGPIESGAYNFELVARNGTGCGLTGGGNDSGHCRSDFQLPGPTFGDVMTIVMP